MADAYHKTVAPGSLTTIADTVTTPGGPAVLIQNLHATEPVWLTGGTTTITAYAFRVAAGKTVGVVLGGDDRISGFSGTSTVTTTVAVFRSTYPSAGSYG